MKRMDMPRDVPFAISIFSTGSRLSYSAPTTVSSPAWFPPRTSCSHVFVTSSNAGHCDYRGGLQADQLTARVVEIELGLHQSDNKPLLRIQYQDMDHGVTRANLDLAGYIQTDGQ